MFNERLFKVLHGGLRDKIMGRRKEQKEIRQEMILKYCLERFIKVGFSETKIRDIAKDLDMSVGLFFNYYESKEKIYAELVRRATQSMAMISRKENEAPLNFFERMIKESLEAFEKDEMACQLFVLMAQTLYSDTVPMDIKAELYTQKQLFELPISMIEEGQRAGTIREGNPLAISVMFWSTIKGVAETKALFPELPLPRAEWLLDMVKKH